MVELGPLKICSSVKHNNTGKNIKIKFLKLYVKGLQHLKNMFKKISWIMVRTLCFMVFYLALFYLPLPRSAVALKIDTFTIPATIISNKLVATGGGDIDLEFSNSFIPQNFIFLNLSCSYLKGSISRAYLLT